MELADIFLTFNMLVSNSYCNNYVFRLGKTWAIETNRMQQKYIRHNNHIIFGRKYRAKTNPRRQKMHLAQEL